MEEAEEEGEEAGSSSTGSSTAGATKAATTAGAAAEGRGAAFWRAFIRCLPPPDLVTCLAVFDEREVEMLQVRPLGGACGAAAG